MSGEKRLRTHFGVDCTELFDDLLEQKAAKIQELKDAVNSEVSAKLDYEHKFNPNFYINVARFQYPRPTRKYCKPILHEDNVELPIITVEAWE